MNGIENNKGVNSQLVKNKKMKVTAGVSMLLFAICSLLVGCDSNSQNTAVDKEPMQASAVTVSPQVKANIDIWPKLNIAVKADADIESKVDILLAQMSLNEKIAQMIQPEIRDITVEDMRRYGFGSYLNGGGSFPNNDKYATPDDWIKLAEAMYQASIDATLDGNTIPTMWGTDAVHGHNNVIGATLFPHNIGLGAANNPELIEKIAEITATEVMVTGIDWVFAPTVAVVRDDRWGRTYEGYSEDPDIVKAYSSAIVKGLQGHANKDFLGDNRVISTVKHFIGDGGTQDGDDQGDNISSEQELFDLHAQGYVGGLTAGAQSVMASFNSWHGDKLHGNKYLLTEVLKKRMGFDGFVVGDWNGHGQVKGCSNESCPQAINAGLDIFMAPTKSWKALYENTIAQVKSGEISQTRIDDAVSRILRVKFRAGLFEKASPANRPLSGKTQLIGAQSHRDVARQAVRESLVLLKNNANLLPLSPKQHILLAGDGADNIGKQSGGWSVTWQGTGNKNSDFPGGSSIYDGFVSQVMSAGGKVSLSPDGSFSEKPDVAIVVFGEEPYAEGHGDIDNLEYQRGDKQDLALLNSLKAQGIPVVSVFISGRPLWVNAELNASDAFVVAWLPGSEGNGVAEVLLKAIDGSVQYDFVGKLSFSWPKTALQSTVNRFDENYQPLLPYGFGLHYGEKSRLSDRLNEQSGSNSDELKTLKIFERAAQKPWQLFIQSDKDTQIVRSNVQTLGSISLKAVDKVVQEDARQVAFAGRDSASLLLQANFPEDLRAYGEADFALSFNVKVDESPLSAVELSMLCESIGDQHCAGVIDVTDILSGLTVDTWQQLTIDLQCFKAAGADLAKITSPFRLSTTGKLTITLADIVIQEKVAEQSDLSCQ
ncbi:MAG: exo 1,3/1,4-beta-D-glucan glucohydrolase [Colwellia sp.]